jgi:hypothetical protein
MSVEKAKEFLQAVSQDPKLQKLATGWTAEDLKAAATQMKGSGELSESDLDNVAGGDCSYHCC